MSLASIWSRRATSAPLLRLVHFHYVLCHSRKHFESKHPKLCETIAKLYNPNGMTPLVKKDPTLRPHVLPLQKHLKPGERYCLRCVEWSERLGVNECSPQCSCTEDEIT